MTRSLPIRARSAFDDAGFAATLDALVAQTQALYLADEVPWVVGYSGGKDSTAVLQLTWMALAGLPAGQRTQAGARDQHRHPGGEPGRSRLGHALAGRAGGLPRNGRACRSRRTGSRPR